MIRIVKRLKRWRHSASDGRGNRIVYVNGAEMKGVTYADIRRGIAKVVDYPIRFNRNDRAVTRVLRGRVDVVFPDELRNPDL